MQRLSGWISISAMQITGAKVCQVCYHHTSFFFLVVACNFSFSILLFTLFYVFRLYAGLMRVRHYLEALFPGLLTWKCDPYRGGPLERYANLQVKVIFWVFQSLPLRNFSLLLRAHGYS